MSYELCDQEGHEFVGNYGYDYPHHDLTGKWRMRADKDEPNRDGSDHATHRVRILSPAGAIEANGQDTMCCAGCAAKLAEAYIGFEWDVEVRRRDALDSETEEN